MVQGSVYEGKAKRVTVLDASTVELFFKDDATAFNGVKHAVFSGKGALNSQISELLYNHLGARGIPHHFIERVDERTLRCANSRMFALEVVVRYRVAGSLAKRTGMPAGTPCEPAVLEFYYKRDDLGDPIINDDHIRLLGLATPDELREISTLGRKTADHLHALAAAADLHLVDLKLEFGRTQRGIVLADEISPDSCRFHDRSSGRMLDKDLFRQDAGDLLVGYREVFSRLQAASNGMKKSTREGE